MGTPAGGFYTLHHGVDGYAREEEIVVLIMGEDVDVFVSSNMETWINENSRLSDTVLRFLVALMWESQYAWRVCGNGLPFSAGERRSCAMACVITVGFLEYRNCHALPWQR